MELKSKLPASAIDTTQDPQATGYPDSRKLVRDSAGNLYAAYRKKGADQAYHIFVATLRQGSQHWQNPTQIEQVGALNQRVPALAIDQNDTLHIAWYGLYAGSQGKHDRQVYYSRGRRMPNGQLIWDTPIMPAGVIPGYTTVQPEPTLWQEHPVIHAAQDGALYIVWEGKDQTSGKKAQVKLICSRNGGASWTPWRNLPGTPGVHYSRPTLVAGEEGRTLYCLAYATGPNRQARLVWTQTDNAENQEWQPWQEVAPVADQDQRHVSVVIDGANYLHAVWQQKSAQHPDGAQIAYACFIGGQWSTPICPVTNPTAFQTFPSLTMDPTGQLWLAWNEFSREPDFHSERLPDGAIRVARKPPTGPWQGLDADRLSQRSSALYPSLRWQRANSADAVDLLWLEATDQSARRYVLGHAELAGRLFDG